MQGGYGRELIYVVQSKDILNRILTAASHTHYNIIGQNRRERNAEQSESDAGHGWKNESSFFIGTSISLNETIVTDSTKIKSRNEMLNSISYQNHKLLMVHPGKFGESCQLYHK